MKKWNTTKPKREKLIEKLRIWGEKTLIYLLFTVYNYVIILSNDEDGLVRVAEVV